jgi:hypothetical protein
MEHGLLNEFLAWAQGHGEPELGAVTDNPGAWIDFETVAAMGRITYWSSGHCYAEIIDSDTSATLYQKHWDTLLPERLESELLGFFGVLRSTK